MSKELFTQGEWSYTFDSEPSRYSDGLICADGFYIAIIAGYNNHCVFGGRNRDFNDGYEGQDHKEHEANARLLSKSKDMYYLLKDIMNHQLSIDDNCCNEVQAMLNEIRGE